MSLNVSRDEHCYRGGIALDRFDHTVKVVDDMLTHSDAFTGHLNDVQEVLLRYREHINALNPRKLQFAQESVTFCGDIISQGGIASDPEKMRAIADFSMPTNMTAVRSFLGLVHQLHNFTVRVTSASDPL